MQIVGSHKGAEYMNLRKLLYYITLFTAPLFTVSPWQNLFGIPVGVIYGILVMLMMLFFYREIIGAFRNTGLNSISPYPFIIYMAVGVLSLAGLLLSGGAESESYVNTAYTVFSIAVCWAFAVIPEDYEMLMDGIAVYLAGAVVACLYGFYYTVGYMAGFDTGMYLTWTVPRLFGTATEPQVFGNFVISALTGAVAFYVFKVRKMSGAVMLPVLWVLGLSLVMTFAAGAWVGFLIGMVVLLPGIRSVSWQKVGRLTAVLVLIVVALVGIDKLIYPGYLTGFPSIMQKFTGKPLNINTPEAKPEENKKSSDTGEQKKNETSKAGKSETLASASENSHLISDEQSYKLNMWSINERKWLRAAAWNMFKVHPLIGVGVGKFGSLYNQYKPGDAPEMNYVSVKAHNQYMQILAETGIIGFIAYLLMFGYCIFIVLFAFIHNFDSSVKYTILGFFASLVAMSIQGYSFGVFNHNYFWVIMGLTYAAFRVSAGQNTRRLFSL